MGTYTARESEGIYGIAFDPETGALGTPAVAARTPNPSALLRHPSTPVIYCVNELWEWEGRPGGGVSAFAIDPASGALEPLNSSFSHGADPCHLSIDPSGRFLFVSNFTGGNLAVIPVREDGTLEQASHVVEHSGSGPHPRRQAGPHVHASLPTADGKWVIAADLGIDRLVVYAFDRQRGELRPHTAASLAPGAGPRHLALHPGAPILLVCNELDSTVASLSWDPARGHA